MKKIFLVILTLFCSTYIACRGCKRPENDFNAKSAFAYTERIVSIGPRISGTVNAARTADFLAASLKKISGMNVVVEPFTAHTPKGPVEMRNVIGTLKGCGTRSNIVILSCHYDTKRIDSGTMVGANDAASACGIVLELASVLSKKRWKEEIRFVFFDGEEAVLKWGPKDGKYGSRYMAGSMKERGELKKIKFLINLDMIGDRDLDVALDTNSTSDLVLRFMDAAVRSNTSRYFFKYRLKIDDDHIPFAEAGVPVLELIDFHYGGNGTPGRWWHTTEDNMDKISQASLDIIGKTVLDFLVHSLHEVHSNECEN